MINRIMEEIVKQVWENEYNPTYNTNGGQFGFKKDKGKQISISAILRNKYWIP